MCRYNGITRLNVESPFVTLGIRWTRVSCQSCRNAYIGQLLTRESRVGIELVLRCTYLQVHIRIDDAHFHESISSCLIAPLCFFVSSALVVFEAILHDLLVDFGPCSVSFTNNETVSNMSVEFI